MEALTTLLLIVSGVAAGTVGSMIGVGGGMIIIPVLTQYFPGWTFEQARATALLTVIATSGGVAVATGKERFANPRLGVALAVPTVIIAFLNALYTSRVGVSVLFGLFALVMVVTSVLMWRSQEPEDAPPTASRVGAPRLLDGEYVDPKSAAHVHYQVRRVPALLGVSSAAGALSALLGIGGGVFQVPAMTLLGGVPIRAAAATSNFILGLTAAASLPVYFGRGHVRPVESAAVLLGVLTGAWIGSAYAKRLAGPALRRFFSLILIVIAYQMASKAFGR